MKKELQDRKMDTVSVIAVFCLFAVSLLLLLMLGGNAYKGIDKKSRDRHDKRVCLSYISTKVKNSDGAGKVYLNRFYGLPALYLEEEYDKITYQTIIYFYSGRVRELFSEAGLDLSPESGTPVFEAESLDFEAFNGGLIKVTVNSDSLLIYPRGKAGLAVSRDDAACNVPYPLKGGAGIE